MTPSWTSPQAATVTGGNVTLYQDYRTSAANNGTLKNGASVDIIMEAFDAASTKWVKVIDRSKMIKGWVPATSIRLV